MKRIFPFVIRDFTFMKVLSRSAGTSNWEFHSSLPFSVTLSGGIGEFSGRSFRFEADETPSSSVSSNFFYDNSDYTNDNHIRIRISPLYTYFPTTTESFNSSSECTCSTCDFTTNSTQNDNHFIDHSESQIDFAANPKRSFKSSIVSDFYDQHPVPIYKKPRTHFSDQHFVRPRTLPKPILPSPSTESVPTVTVPGSSNNFFVLSKVSVFSDGFYTYHSSTPLVRFQL